MSEIPTAQDVRVRASDARPSATQRRRAAHARSALVIVRAFHRLAVVCSIALFGFSTARAQGRRTDAPRGLAAPTKENASWAVLRKAIQSRDYAVRLLATQALGGIRSVDVTAWIEHSLADPEHDVRVAAVDALDRVRSRRALELLRSVRDDETEALDIRALAASALINHADE